MDVISLRKDYLCFLNLLKKSKTYSLKLHGYESVSKPTISLFSCTYLCNQKRKHCTHTKKSVAPTQKPKTLNPRGRTIVVLAALSVPPKRGPQQKRIKDSRLHLKTQHPDTDTVSCGCSCVCLYV